MTTLSDLGERKILREIIPRYVDGAGDDCAILEIKGKYAVATTDPVPRPAAEVIGKDDDPFWLGWLLVTINASDVAAAGARPEAFLAHLDLPGDYDVTRFERLLEGVRASCERNGLRYVGGNLREAKAFSGVGSAIGSSRRKPLTRRGGQPGDRVMILGRSGDFWSDAFRMDAGQTVDKSVSPLFSPVSQAPFAFKLHDEGLVKAAMDTSDGLAPTLEELSIVNGSAIEIGIDALKGEPNGLVAPYLRERLSFGWGDWTVALVVAPEMVERVVETARDAGTSATCVGELTSDPSGLFLRADHRRIRAGRLESERFAADSWFIKGIDAYKAMLAAFALP